MGLVEASRVASHACWAALAAAVSRWRCSKAAQQPAASQAQQAARLAVGSRYAPDLEKAIEQEKKTSRKAQWQAALTNLTDAGQSHTTTIYTKVGREGVPCTQQMCVCVHARVCVRVRGNCTCVCVCVCACVRVSGNCTCACGQQSPPGCAAWAAQ